MIYKTRGVVFRFTKFQESSIIVTIFTEQFGLQTYIVNGVRSKSARNKIALYQPLTLLNLVVYHRENVNIERIKEASCLHPYRTLTTDIRKSTIALFINELLNKTIREESHAAEVFQFICDSLISLDQLPDGHENFHLIFMLKLSHFVGFGVTHSNELVGGRTASAETEALLPELLAASYETPLKIANTQRRAILDLLLKFYSEHIGHLGEFKSLPVLREILQ